MGGGKSKNQKVELKKHPGQAFIRTVDRKQADDPNTDLEAAETLPLAPRKGDHKTDRHSKAEDKQCVWLHDLIKKTNSAPEPAKFVKIDVNKACSYLKPRKLIKKPEDPKPEITGVFHRKPPLSRT